ncbi:hypothetical protein SUGI_0314220 [Cryptomeria japonica]|nr:hypothetical protein SUGI_0314220 [Cryptomeria japonica]
MDRGSDEADSKLTRSASVVESASCRWSPFSRVEEKSISPQSSNLIVLAGIHRSGLCKCKLAGSGVVVISLPPPAVDNAYCVFLPSPDEFWVYLGKGGH